MPGRQSGGGGARSLFAAVGSGASVQWAGVGKNDAAYSGKRIFTHETVRGGKWWGFSHGGTLKDLVKEFRDYICTGESLHLGHLGPERFNDSNIWGLLQGRHARGTRAGRRPSRLPSARRGGRMKRIYHSRPMTGSPRGNI